MLGRGQVGYMGRWKEVVAEIQNELKNLKVPLCEPGEGVVESKGGEAKRPNNLTVFPT